MNRLEQELAIARQFQPLAEKLQTLNEQLMETVDRQQEELVRMQQDFARCILDRQGWQNRAEQAEKMLMEVLAEKTQAQPISFPTPSVN